MRFFINGTPRIVVVDDYLPSQGGGEMWPYLLEKAWAKLHGSYSLMEGSTTAMVLSMLTN